MEASSKQGQIRRRILRWYETNRRDLPWRKTHDPYAIWVAETMLQQTQVKTVLAYYQRFLRAFPTIQALHRAPRYKVLTLWTGLGYYRRAVNLKKAAHTIIHVHGGRLPETFSALLRLPGIGPYTAGALMSIAFNKPYPALDGNARRVLQRLFNISREEEIRATARLVVSPRRPGHFNQALMELGSRICLSREPNCPACPLAPFCVSRRTGSFPATARSRKTTKVDWPLALINQKGKILLHQRPYGGLLEGLWEIPGGERRPGETMKSALRRHLNGLGQQVTLGHPTGEIRHTITSRRIRAPLFFCQVGKEFRLPGPEWRWMPIPSLHRHPLSSLSLKAVRHLM